MEIGKTVSCKKLCKEAPLSAIEIVFFILCWLGAFLVNIKMVFASFCNDSAICAVMAMRLVRGDRLFVEMWEPHQTSAILPALFSKIYLCFSDNTEGMIIWLHLCGVFVFAVVSITLILLLKKHLSIRILNYCALLIFLLRPKFANMPDYVNMSIAFTTFLWIFLVKYANERRKVYLIIGSLFACMSALAYPSNALIFFLLLAMVYFINSRKAKDCLWVLVTYCVFFGSFLAVVMIRGKLGVFGLLESCKNIFEADGHSTFRTSGWPYFRYAVYGLVICFAFAAISYLIKKLCRKTFFGTYAVVSVIGAIIVNVVFALAQRKSLCTFEWIYLNYVVAFSDIVFGFIAYKKIQLGKEEKTAYLLGICISAGVFINTMILTDLPLASILGYLPLGLAVSMIPISEYAKAGMTEDEENGLKKIFTYVFAISTMILVMFYQMFICSDSSTWVTTVADVEVYIKQGPEKYCFSLGGYRDQVNESIEEWQANVSESDSVLIVPGYPYELIGYMYSESKISNYSATSAPSFNEDKLLLYWEMFPDRKPTVMAVQCQSGVENRTCPKWLSEYIDENYTCSYSGNRWNLYR